MDEDYIVDRGIHYRFLASAATFLNRIQSPSLRCHMNLHSADVLGRTNRQLYVKKNKRTIVCQHCHTPWKYGDFALRVLPKAKLGKKMRKILCKKRNDKPLSPIQKKLADMHHGNTVVLKCGTCEKSTRLKTFWNLMPEQMETSEVTDISQNVKKKKKKKNKYSGLNPAVMKTLHPSNEDESDVIYLDENSVSDNDCPPPKKRKKNKDDVSNILETETKKTNKHKRKSIKANPLPITPLGGKPIANNKGDGFIPLSQQPSEKTGKGSDMKVNKPVKKKNKKLLNPFANQGQQQVKETKKGKKLSRWKKLVAAADEGPKNSSSLQDFLSGILR